MSSVTSQVTHHDFEKYLNQTFCIAFTDEQKWDVLLVKVEKGLPNGISLILPFSVIFVTNEKNRYFQQGIYTLIHPEKGEMELFMVPLGPSAEGMQYEIVFS